jgi:hypothetical protein
MKWLGPDRGGRRCFLSITRIAGHIICNIGEDLVIFGKLFLLLFYYFDQDCVVVLEDGDFSGEENVSRIFASAFEVLNNIRNMGSEAIDLFFDHFL